jgi:hypothetical protein
MDRTKAEPVLEPGLKILNEQEMMYARCFIVVFWILSVVTHVVG